MNNKVCYSFHVIEHIGESVYIITTHNLWYRGTDVKVRFGGRLILSETFGVITLWVMPRPQGGLLKIQKAFEVGS